MSNAELARVYKTRLRTPLRKEIRTQSKGHKEFHVDLSQAALVLSGITPDQIATVHAEAATFAEWDPKDKKLKFTNKFALDRAMKLIFKQLKRPSERERANQSGVVPSPIDYKLTRSRSDKVPKPPSNKTTVTIRNKYSISDAKATSLLVIDIPTFDLPEVQHQALVEKTLQVMGKDAVIANKVLAYLVNKFVKGKTPADKGGGIFRSNEASAMSTRYVATQTIDKPKLKDQEEKFTSANSILKQIRERSGGSLHDELKKNMVFPRLRYRSGRLARSVKLTRATQTGTDVNVFYKWHGFPYSLFEEPGFRYYTEQRRPDKLVDKTIRDLAIGLVNDRFNLRIVRE